MKFFQANQTKMLNQLKCYNCFDSTLWENWKPIENWVSKVKFLLAFTILDLSLLFATLGRFWRSSSWCGCRLLLLHPPRMPRYQLSNTEHQLFPYNIIKKEISSQEKMGRYCWEDGIFTFTNLWRQHFQISYWYGYILFSYPFMIVISETIKIKWSTKTP